MLPDRPSRAQEVRLPEFSLGLPGSETFARPFCSWQRCLRSQAVISMPPSRLAAASRTWSWPIGLLPRLVGS